MLSVIITTKDRVSLLEHTLKLVKEIPRLNEVVLEIIIVNDGSADLTSLASQYQCAIIKNKSHGLAAGRNTGASIAKANYLLFYDDDILPTTSHFMRHLEVQKNNPGSIVTANRFYPSELIKLAEKKPFGRYKLKHEYNWLEGCNLRPVENNNGLYYSDGAAGFSCCMPKSIWLDLGGFNENFQYAGCEDNEFFYRARQKGYHVIFDETNTCYHNELDNFELKRWLHRQATGIKGAVVITNIHPEGKLHPTYYLNTPISNEDSPEIKRIKKKRTALSRQGNLNMILFLTRLGEAIHLPDKILFRLYNAAWLGTTKKSFMEAYQSIGK